MATMRACDVGAQDQLIVLDWGISWVIPPQGGGAQVLDGKRPHWLESVTVQLVHAPHSQDKPRRDLHDTAFGWGSCRPASTALVELRTFEPDLQWHRCQ